MHRPSAVSPSSRGLGHRPFTAVTGVRIPLGTPIKSMVYEMRRRLVSRSCPGYLNEFDDIENRPDINSGAAWGAMDLLDLGNCIRLEQPIEEIASPRRTKACRAWVDRGRKGRAGSPIRARPVGGDHRHTPGRFKRDEYELAL